MKKYTNCSGRRSLPAKTVIVFTFFSCFALFFSSNIRASVDNYARHRYSIEKSSVPLGEILREIESASDFTFFYHGNNIDVTVPVTVSVSEATIDRILDLALKGTGYTYQILDRQILLTRIEDNLAQAQESGPRRITGTVVDPEGEAIAGATVIVAGSTTGTATAADGSFSLDIPGNAVLQVSFLGYETQEIRTGTRTFFRIVMEYKVDFIDDVIVVAYGTTSIRKTVSAVGSLKTDKIAEVPYRNMSAALEGRIAGVVVQENSGEPGQSDIQISIRGGGDPLFVIDGVIRDKRAFNALQVSDIESFNILKDASATAVYGAQAGNGIVMVKTKRGTPGRMNVTYNGAFDWSQPTKIPTRLNSLEYATAVNKAAEYDGLGSYFVFDQSQVQQMENGTYIDNDWYKEATNKFAPANRHNISVSGTGNNGLSYFLSGGYLDQKSIFKESHNNTYKRYNARSNVSTTFDKIGLEVGLNMDMSYEKQTPNPYGQSQIWRNLIGYNKATDRIWNDDGTLAALSVHPIAWLDKESGYDHKRWNEYNTQLYGIWSLPWVEGLKFRVQGNTNYRTHNYKQFASAAPQYTSDGTLVEQTDSKLEMYNSWRRTNDVEGGFEYSRSIRDHSFSLQGVYAYNDYYNEYFSAYRTGFISNDFDQLFAGDASTQSNTGYASKYARIGYVGRAQYNYASKYFFEGNFRYDGSDNFARDSRWGFFPSAAVSWVISEEKFMSGLKASNIVNFLKIRTSYGKVGLEKGLDRDDIESELRFGYIPVYNYNSQAAVIGGQYVGGFSEGNLVSSDLGWYTKDVFDIGVDFVTLDNKLNVSFDYFYYKTKGYLISPQNVYYTTLGKSLPVVKSGSINRRAGFEFDIKYNGRLGDFTYSLGLNMTKYNELWEVYEQESESDLMDPRIRKTQRKSHYDDLLYVSTGIYQDIWSVLNSPRRTGSTELKPGDLGYKDINGDGVIDSQDMIRTGKPFFPTLQYGFNFNLEYKGFFLYGLINGTGKRNVMISGLMLSSDAYLMNLKYQADFWMPDNTGASHPRLSTISSINSSNNTISSTFWLKNAAYLNLKSLQFGYDFKKILLRHTDSISSLGVSLIGTNLVFISGVKKYFDPTGMSGSGQYYPIQRTFSLSLNVGF